MTAHPYSEYEEAVAALRQIFDTFAYRCRYSTEDLSDLIPKTALKDLYCNEIDLGLGESPVEKLFNGRVKSFWFADEWEELVSKERGEIIDALSWSKNRIAYFDGVLTEWEAGE